MLEQQVRPSEVLNPHVLKALEEVKRSQFVDESLSGLAYADTELPIGFGQVMLPPVLVGRLLQALDVQSNEDVLEIGTGSGYCTALLAKLAHYVFSVELIAELSEIAQQHLVDADINNVTFYTGDASQGWPLSGRVDVIISSAAFVSVPDEFLQSLNIGGRMLAVVGDGALMSVNIIRRVTEWEWQTDSLFETVIPAMINTEPKAEFEF